MKFYEVIHTMYRQAERVTDWRKQQQQQQQQR